MAAIRKPIDDPALSAYRLYRIFFHTAEPLASTLRHPISGARIELSRSDVYAQGKRMIDAIELEPDVAVRRGVLVHHGWQIGTAALQRFTKGAKTVVEPRDVEPRIEQKGVDMRIGLDLASLAFKRVVGAVLLISGDSDLVPAMKLARREGLRVYLHMAGAKGRRRELRNHADRVV